jgi:hypothetical protein
MRHTRNNQIIRQWRLLLALNHREWFSLLELRDCLPKPRPHKRTIMRDMEGLARVFPIERRQGDSRLPFGQKGTIGYQFEYRLRRPLTSLLKK